MVDLHSVMPITARRNVWSIMLLHRPVPRPAAFLVLTVLAFIPSTGRASIILPESARIAPPVEAPLFRAACAHYWDLHENSDGMGHDNHTPLGLEFLLNYAQRPPPGVTVPDALRALPTIDLAHHRRHCYSNGETPGGAVWPLDSTGAAAGVVTIRGFLNVRSSTDGPIDWTLALAANDATRVRIGGQLVLEEYWSDSTRWKKFVHLRFPRPGVYSLEIDNATNHVCNLDPIELYYAPGWIAGLDGACGCGPGCAFDTEGCGERTATITSRGPFRLVDSSLLMALPTGAQPPALDRCTITAQVVDPANPERWLSCMNDGDCAAPTPVCSDEQTCISGCGNARLDMGETCDDGNTADGDGCSRDCRTEPGYRCVEPVEITNNSSFDRGTTGWTEAGATVEVARESERGGVVSSNFVAEIDRSPSWAGGPRVLRQTLAFVPGGRYSISLRYARALDAPSTVGALVELTGASRSTMSVSATGPTAWRSTIRTFTATAATGTLSLRFDPDVFSSESPHGLLVDDVAVHQASRCEVLDSDNDGISNPIELAIGTNPFDSDSDHDSILDPDELGAAPNYLPIDHDGDGTIDALDPDDDGDGLPTHEELGEGGFASPRNTDATVPMDQGTRDTLPDYLDPDDDGDGIDTAIERSLERTDTDGDNVPAWYDTDSDGDTIADRVEAGAFPANPANSDRALEPRDAPDFLDTDSDNDCVLDSDPSEHDTARIDPARPRAAVDENCAATMVCLRAFGVCVPPVGFITVTAKQPAVVDAGIATDAALQRWTLSGDGACACRAPSAQGANDERAVSAEMVMGGLALAYGVRRKRTKNA
jgi:cysteine-rich repeat protein